MMLCPCGLPAKYESCCGRYVGGSAPAPTPEALMRSRYTAYALRKIEYLIETHRPRPAEAGVRAFAESVTFTGLTVLDARGDEVEFEARFDESGRERILAERSRFEQGDGRWFYVGQANNEQQAQRRSGGLRPTEPTARSERSERSPKVGRNDPCSCGSGKKHKKCCGGLAGGPSVR